MQHHQHQQQQHHQHPQQLRQEHQQHHQHHPQQQPQQQQHSSHHHQQPQQSQQQQQQHQQQQQQQQFMADTDPWLSEDGQDEFMPKVVQRRAKRIIPDTEKDDKYWEKRKRNNMAAKRSRENKRLMENDIRHKVSFLEEQNALLRKEISLIKGRYGIPADQSLLTPEERAQCVQEVKLSQESQLEASRKENSPSSPDDVSSTSPNVYPVGMSQQQADEEEDSGDRHINAEGSSSSPKLKEEGMAGPGGAGNDSVYGASAYGPFNPSPSWGPTGPGAMPNYSNVNLTGNANSPNNVNPAAFSPPTGSQTKLPPISNAFQEKHNNPYDRYVNGGLMSYGRGPYDYFMQYASQNSHMLYPTGDMNHAGGIAPADLSTGRGKRPDERVLGRGVEVRNPDVPENMAATHSIGSSMAPNLELDDVAVMASTLGQVPRSQEQFPVSRGMGLPVQMPGSSTNGQSLPAETAHTAGNNGGIGGPDQENLKRENDALKMAVRTLTAQVEHMKDQAYKD